MTNLDAWLKYSSGEIQSIALELIWPVETGYRLDSLEKIDHYANRIRERRTEYANYNPGRVRRAIARWFDYYERENKRTRQEAIVYRRVSDAAANVKARNEVARAR